MTTHFLRVVSQSSNIGYQKRNKNVTSSSLISYTYTHTLTHKRKHTFRLWLNMNVCTDKSVGYFPPLNTLAV